jgi:opacity protein-like surface antigen
MEMKRMILAGAILIASMATASASGIAPQCMRMRDAVGCTCAVDNGGGVYRRRGGGRAWYSVRRRKDLVNEAFVRCQMEAKLGSSKPLPNPSLNDYSGRRYVR